MARPAGRCSTLALIFAHVLVAPCMGSRVVLNALHGKCECEILDEQKGPMEILQDAAAADKDNCCENYGPKFGNWGIKHCPSSLGEVVSDLQEGFIQANSGASGVAPTITSKYVLKVINGQETKVLFGLLGELPKSDHTFIDPSCYIIRVKEDGTSLLISPKIVLAVAGEAYDVQHTFDLKGNFDWQGRAKPKLDKEFKEMFPYGMSVEAASFQTGPLQPPEEAIQVMMSDTDILGTSLGIMDYSLFAHMIRIPAAEFNEREKGAIAAANSDKPLVWAQSGGEFYIMTIGIIDMLMHEEWKGATLGKRWYNWIGNNVVYRVKCRAKDPDPLDAIPYRIRFLRMFGFYASVDCGTCLFDGYTNCYTYFKSAYQEKMRQPEPCAWAGGGMCA